MNQATIFGDWGTTRLRLFRKGGDGTFDQLVGPGIGQLVSSPDQALLSTLAPWLDRGALGEVLLCGMAGSRNGLIEVNYATTPAGVRDWAHTTTSVPIAGVRVRVAGGLSGANFSGHPDVMRGEEAQLFGALALDPRLATGRHILVLPGTHCKWVEMRDGVVERFHTFPSGEVFAILSAHSTLTRAGTDGAGREQGFADGLERATDGLLGHLFEARAAQLLAGRTHGWALGFLSGLLIGSELREAASLLGRAFSAITLIGDPALSDIYHQAASHRGLNVTMLDGDACAIAGLGQLHSEFKEIG